MGRDIHAITSTRARPSALRWLDEHSALVLAAGLAAALAAGTLRWKNARAIQGRARRRAAAAAPRQRSSPGRPPVVSVLLPAWNEAAHLPACLASLLAVDYPALEIVVCAGGEDGTLEAARAASGERVFVLEQYAGEGKQKSLQKCLERATGEVIFLTDADSRVDTDSFLRTLEPILAGEEEACTGSRRPLPGQEARPLVAYQWAYHRYMEAVLPDYIDTLYGINAAVRRPALEKSGAFVLRTPIGTDLLAGQMLLRAGYRIRFIRSSRVCTDYPARTLEYIRQQSRWFRNRMVLSARNRHYAGLAAQLRIGAAACFLLGAPLAGGRGRKVVLSAWLAGVVYLALAQLQVLALVRKLDGKEKSTRIPAGYFFPFLVTSWLASARGLVESLLPGRRGIW